MLVLSTQNPFNCLQISCLFSKEALSNLYLLFVYVIKLTRVTNLEFVMRLK